MGTICKRIHTVHYLFVNKENLKFLIKHVKGLILMPPIDESFLDFFFIEKVNHGLKTYQVQIGRYNKFSNSTVILTVN